MSSVDKIELNEERGGATTWKHFAFLVHRHARPLTKLMKAHSTFFLFFLFIFVFYLRNFLSGDRSFVSRSMVTSLARWHDPPATARHRRFSMKFLVRFDFCGGQNPVGRKFADKRRNQWRDELVGRDGPDAKSSTESVNRRPLSDESSNGAILGLVNFCFNLIFPFTSAHRPIDRSGQNGGRVRPN